jgi:hypothetical protein
MLNNFSEVDYMTALQRIQQIALAFSKYAPLAVAAVAQVQTEVGAAAGDPAIQASKKQLALAYVLAAAHAGELVPVGTVQTISGLIDLVASTSKALGAFGKIPGMAPVVVPPLTANPASPVVTS